MIKKLLFIIAIAGFLASCGGEEKKDEAKQKRIEAVKKYVKTMQDSMKALGVDHLSEYSLEYVSHQIKDTTTVDSAAVDTTIVTIALADFDTKAGEYTGKSVQISGIVDHVCKHGGKKLLLVSDNARTHVFKAEGRFDDNLKGNEITVTGVVKEEKIDEAFLQKLIKDAEEDKDNAKGSKHEDEAEHKDEHK